MRGHSGVKRLVQLQEVFGGRQAGQRALDCRLMTIARWIAQTSG